MLKLQKLAVAAAIWLLAVSAMASNFRAADQIYVPNAGHIQGSSGLFISDVFIANLSNDPVTISVIFSGLLGGTSQQKNYNDKFTLAANERKEFVDFFANTLGESSAFGQLIFNACKSGADCVATQDPISGDSPFFRPISVETRIYAIPTGTTLAQNPPTVGQLFAGIPWYNFATSDAPDGYNKIFITGIRNTGTGAGTTSTTGAGTPARCSTATANRVTAAMLRMTSSWPELTIRYLPPGARPANCRRPNRRIMTAPEPAGRTAWPRAR